jgi:hypothetical protein
MPHAFIPLPDLPVVSIFYLNTNGDFSFWISSSDIASAYVPYAFMSMPFIPALAEVIP